MQQPFLIVFPLFISVFIVRVLPRIILAPFALFILMVLNWWFDPSVDELQFPAKVPLVVGEEFSGRDIPTQSFQFSLSKGDTRDPDTATLS